MNILSRARHGKLSKPYLLVLHGPPGVGKSTFASQMPTPIFLGAEDGTSNLDTSRVHLNSFDELTSVLGELTTEAHQYRTLVVDSLDWLEPIIWKKVCTIHQVEHIEMIGYGKGYQFAMSLWGDVIHKLDALRSDRGMNIVAIAHSHIKNISDPSTNQSYDRFTLKLNERASALWREYAECVLFCTYDTVVKEDKNGKTKAYSNGERIMFTEWRPGMDAKNRYNLPFKMALSFSEFHAHAQATLGPNAADLYQSILQMSKSLTDEKVYNAVIEATEKAKQDSVQLNKIRSRLEGLLSKKEE